MLGDPISSGLRKHMRMRRSAVLAIVLITSLAPTVVAKHQLIPPQGINAIGDCDNTAQGPCIEWPKTGSNLSWPVDVYLSDKLSGEEVNLKTDVRNSFAEYNPMPARNPYLQEISVSGSAELVATLSLQDFNVYASTVSTIGPSPAYHISHTLITFNSAILWNRSLDFHCYVDIFGVDHCYSDARKVSNHEMGHAEGLSHQPAGASSVMIQGPLTYYHVGAADVNNIQLIYGTYP
jgi:hypothetical protein